jgi:hypothetical protein
MMSPVKRFLTLVLLVSGCGDVTTSNSDAPKLASISPDRGGLPGGTTVTLTGSGFVDAGENHVVVGQRMATDVVAASDTELTFTLPPGDDQAVAEDVMLFNENGVAVLPRAITYNPVPLIRTLSRSISSSSGGAVITIQGRGFMELNAGVPSVQFADAAAAAVEVVSDTELSATVPGRPAGTAPFEPLDVSVGNANGTAVLPGSFRYTGPGLLATSARRGPTRLLYIDPTTYEAREVGSTNGALSGLAVSGDDAVLGYSSQNGGPRSLVVLDPESGAPTVVAAVNDFVSDMAQVGNRMVVMTRLSGAPPPNDRLASINTSTGVLTMISPAGIGVNGKGALTARNATSVFLVTTMDAPIRIINTTSGAVTLGATLNGSAQDQAHGAALVDGDLWVIAHLQGASSTKLLRVTIDTGAVEQLAVVPMVLSAMSATPASFE